MNMYELMSVAKLFSQAMDGKITTSYAEQQMALRILKEMANYFQLFEKNPRIFRLNPL